MNPEIKAAWVAKLRSGEIKQSFGALRTTEGMCCLGVLCELHRELTSVGNWTIGICDDTETLYYYMDSNKILPAPVTQWAGLKMTNPSVNTTDKGIISLGRCNDGDRIYSLPGYTFNQIADLIEAQL